MKRHGFIIYSFMAILALASCKKEDTQYYSVLGTINKTIDSTILESDDGPRLLINNASSIEIQIANNDRVFSYYSLVEKANPEGIDHIIDIYSMEKLLSKQIILLTEQNDDSIGNDELSVSDLWIAKNFLNLNFRYYWSDKTHYINLVRDPGTIPTDTVELEIRHNNNGDYNGSLVGGFVSFDLKTLQKETADSVILQISAKEYDNRTYNKIITYRY